MTERKHIIRDGPGRRNEDFIPKCPWCDSKEEASRERWKNLHDENVARQQACASIITEIKNEVGKMAEQKADKFTVQLVVSILLAALIIFGGINTLMFQSIKSDLRSHTDIKSNISGKSNDGN